MTDVNKYVIGTCDVCEKNGIKVMAKYGNMLFCDECWSKEQKSVETINDPIEQARRISEANARVEAQRAQHPIASIGINEVLRQSREIDNSVTIRTDLFNAATVSIIELKKAIDSDASIDNKPYALAEELKRRFEHHKNLVFELNQQLAEHGNQQRAIQVYLNQLANNLRAEEREKLRIADINYKPAPPKTVSTKSITTKQTSKKTKIDKVELRKYAGEIGVSEFMLQMIVVQKGISVSEAAGLLKKSIEDAKSSKG